MPATIHTSINNLKLSPVRVLWNPVQGYSPVGVQAVDRWHMACAQLWGRFVSAFSLCHISSGPAWEEGNLNPSP